MLAACASKPCDSRQDEACEKCGDCGGHAIRAECDQTYLCEMGADSFDDTVGAFAIL